MSLFAAAIVILITWGAFSYGGLLPWGYWPLLSGCAAIGAWGWMSRERPLVTALGRPLLIAITAVWLAVVTQVVPLPSPVIDRLSPRRAALVAKDASAAAVIPVRAGAAAESAASRTASLSIQPLRTIHQFVFLVAFTIFFAGLVLRLSTPDIEWVVVGTTVLGVVLAILGAVWRPMVPELIEGLSDGTADIGDSLRSPETRVADTFGPFGNRNHFAGWMLMACPLAASYFYSLLQQRLATNSPDRAEARRPWRRSRQCLLLLGVGLSLMALSVVVTRSRSGMGGLLFAVLLIGGLIAFVPRPGRRWPMLAGYIAFLALLILIGVGSGELGPALGRYVDPSGADIGGRVPIWRDAAKIVADFPLAGTGLNTYEQAAREYYTTKGFRHQTAHNDYLQLAAEGGLLLGLPVVVLAVVFVRTVRRLARDSAENTVSFWLRAGASVGLVAIAAQEVFEFSLQMPGNAALFVVLCAVAVHRPDERPINTFSPGPDRTPVPA